jgi:hypothetical protein
MLMKQSMLMCALNAHVLNVSTTARKEAGDDQYYRNCLPSQFNLEKA